MCTMGTVGIMIKLRGLRHPLLLGKAGKQPVTESITFHSTFFHLFAVQNIVKCVCLKFRTTTFCWKMLTLPGKFGKRSPPTWIWPKMELRAPEFFNFWDKFVNILAIILILVIILIITIIMIMIITILNMMTRSHA